MNDKLVCNWKKSEASPKKLPKKEYSSRTGICHWSELENYLKVWINNNCKYGNTVTRIGIRTQALIRLKINPVERAEFKLAVKGKLILPKRKGLQMKQKTKIA